MPTDGTANGTADGTPDGTADGTPDGTADGTPDGTADGTPDGTADGTAGGKVGGTKRRRLFIDLTPLRRSRDFRLIISGQVVSVLGSQMTVVAVAYQVYHLTHSSLDVGLVSLTQLVPLIVGSILGGAVVDAVDRRRLLIVVELLLAASSVGLAVNAGAGRSPALWPLFLLPALAAALSGF